MKAQERQSGAADSEGQKPTGMPIIPDTTIEDYHFSPTRQPNPEKDEKSTVQETRGAVRESLGSQSEPPHNADLRLPGDAATFAAIFPEADINIPEIPANPEAIKAANQFFRDLKRFSPDPPEDEASQARAPDPVAAFARWSRSLQEELNHPSQHVYVPGTRIDQTGHQYLPAVTEGPVAIRMRGKDLIQTTIEAAVESIICRHIPDLDKKRKDQIIAKSKIALAKDITALIKLSQHEILDESQEFNPETIIQKAQSSLSKAFRNKIITTTEDLIARAVSLAEPLTRELKILNGHTSKEDQSESFVTQAFKELMKEYPLLKVTKKPQPATNAITILTFRLQGNKDQVQYVLHRDNKQGYTIAPVKGQAHQKLAKNLLPVGFSSILKRFTKRV